MSRTTSGPNPITLVNLVVQLEELFKLYLQAEPDGDQSTFLSWLDDEVPTLKMPGKETAP